MHALYLEFSSVQMEIRNLWCVGGCWKGGMQFICLKRINQGKRDPAVESLLQALRD